MIAVLFLLAALLALTMADESAVAAASVATTEKFYVCDAADPAFLGTYTRSSSETSDGVAVYSNENEMSIFRNKKFWYMGDLA